MTNIYALYDPRDPSKLPWYVGKGSQNRAESHWKLFLRTKQANAILRCWFEKLKAEGVEPSWCFLEENVENWQEAEKTWIAGCRIINPGLCNIVDGGNQPPEWASQLGAHIRSKLYGNPGTFESRSKGGRKGGRNGDHSKGGRVGGRKSFDMHGNPATPKSCRKGALVASHNHWHVRRGIKKSTCELCQTSC